jgi:hypothetical protein
MAIVAKATGGNFIPAPEGTHSAVCVDVVDLGLLEVKWKNELKIQHKVKVVWQIDEDMQDGKPFLVSKRYTLSLHEKAALRKDLEAWRGRAFTEEELKGFDVENVLGVPCLLNIIHNGASGTVYANVTGLMKLPKSMPAIAGRDYIRVIDREPDTKKQGDGPDTTWAEGITDDDVPF